MKRMRKLVTITSQFLDLPGEAAGGQPKMELTGDSSFSMEPHRGLLEYETEKILIDSSIGPVCVRGNQLTIQLMNRQRITITGEIFGVLLTEKTYE